MGKELFIVSRILASVVTLDDSKVVAAADIQDITENLEMALGAYKTRVAEEREALKTVSNCVVQTKDLIPTDAKEDFIAFEEISMRNSDIKGINRTVFYYHDGTDVVTIQLDRCVMEE